MGHIKVSQIRIHLTENIENYIGTCIFPMFLENPTQVQLLMGPTLGMINFEGSLGSSLVMANTSPLVFIMVFTASASIVHPNDLFFYLFDHHSRLLLKGELFIKEHFSSRIHLSILAYPRFEEAIIREVSPFLLEVPIESAKVFLDSVIAFKES